MAYKQLVFVLSMLITVSPAAATLPTPAHEASAPAAGPGARYCLRVDPAVGSRIETIRCETREGWALLDVDVDHEWADNGVRVIA
jgi:hypothetical protein